MQKKQSGFTLIEIAIVLVIIGLLLGGVLKGQELIKNTKIKNIINDSKAITAAIYTYQDRIKVLPGDDPNGVGPGNGDGDIDGTTVTSESGFLIGDLRAQNLITGSGNSYPKHAFGEEIVPRNNMYTNLRGLSICFFTLTGEIARYVDSSMDDGLPNSGSVQSHNTETAYLITGATTYNLCIQT